MMALSTGAFASNTSGIHGPGVKEGEKSAQLRLALSPGDEDGQADNWAYRAHYQQAFNDKVRGRIILQYRDRGSLQYEYIRAEVLYNVKKKENNGIWSSGVRFDVRQRRSDNPEEFAINWTNQWELSNGFRVRGILIGAWQFGSDKAASGTKIETRLGVSKKIDSGLTLGVEMFNNYGKLGEFGSFNDQSHQIGPMIGGSIGGVKYQLRYLAGVTNGARDHNLGLRFNKSF
ncbi:MAG: hypothetical protein ACJAVV_000745 [Alphaproteobacteria bacterium]|jgi:hypothetical protein